MSLPSKVGAFLRKNAPEPVFGIAKSVYQFVMRPGKLKGEMDYWRMQAIRGGGGPLSNDHYRPIMLAMAKGYDEGFFANKVVADFGCGPQCCRQAAQLAVSMGRARYATKICPSGQAPFARQSANFYQIG